MASKSLILFNNISLSVYIWLLFWRLSGKQLQKIFKNRKTDFFNVFEYVSHHLPIFRTSGMEDFLLRS